jgi:inner membrane protein
MMLPVELNFWHWGGGALVLLVLEMLAPGFYLLWLAIAAGVVALLTLIWAGAPFELQLLVFAVTSIGSIWAWRRWRDKNPETSDQPNLNDRGAQMIGRQFTLDEPVTNGTGRVRVGDSIWKVSSTTDIPAGTTVRIRGADGIVLVIEPVIAIKTE